MDYFNQSIKNLDIIEGHLKSKVDSINKMINNPELTAEHKAAAQGLLKSICNAAKATDLDSLNELKNEAEIIAEQHKP
mgnify:CR=1 FL=1